MEKVLKAIHATLVATAAATALTVTAGVALAQSWKPARTVELVVGSAPGGSPDIMARLVQKIFQETGLLTNATVVNKPGAANTIGWAYLNQHVGDGHYIATISPAVIGNKLMGTSNLNHLDFTPLNIMVREYVVVAVRGDSPIVSLKDLTARMKRDPQSLTFAFATARGNHNHIVMSMYLKSIGIDPRTVKTVVFPGGGPATTALLGGHIDVYVSAPRTMVPLHREGRARVLGISSAQRQSGLAEFPTLKEQGHDAVFFTWRGFMGPKDLKPAEVAYWDATFAKLGQSDEWRRDADAQFWAAEYLLSADTRRHMDTENEQTRGILADLGLIGAPPAK